MAPDCKAATVSREQEIIGLGVNGSFLYFLGIKIFDFISPRHPKFAGGL
jgi:hypothetical protein